MTPTDTSEKGLESIFVSSLVEEAGYVQGDPKDYDREQAVDRAKLLQFLAATQPDSVEKLGINQEGPKQTQFLHRLQGEIAKRGVVNVLRGGIGNRYLIQHSAGSGKRKFAIIIDEAHSSQGGKTTTAMNRVLEEIAPHGDEEETIEDKIIEIMEGLKMLTNASYFAFTATPKNRTRGFSARQTRNQTER